MFKTIKTEKAMIFFSFVWPAQELHKIFLKRQIRQPKYRQPFWAIQFSERKNEPARESNVCVKRYAGYA